MKRIIGMLALLALVYGSGIAHAAECRKLSETCVEPNQTRLINGVNVFRACWRYTAQYECVEPNAIDHCSQLLPHGCWQLNSTCSVVAFNGDCLEFTNVYRCPNEFVPPLPNTTHVNTVRTITKDIINDGCAAHSANPFCQQDSETCIEPGGIRNINGLDVHKDCWKWSRNYDCTSTDVHSTCGPFENDPNCTLINTKCSDTNEINGACILTTKEYQCVTGHTPVESVVNCAGNIFCLGDTGGCFDATRTPDNDFANAVTMMEISRQAGTYVDPNTLTVFNGQKADCKKIIFGLSNCCKSNTKGKGMSNQNFASQLASQAVSGIVVEGIDYVGFSMGNLFGSFYTYDALFMSDAPNWMVNGVESIFGQFGVSNTYTFNPSISAFGFTGTFGAMPTTTLGVSNIYMGKSALFGMGNATFYFNPAMFGISVAVMLINELIACDADEQELALKKGAGLCHRVGSWCDKKILGACVRRKEGYCCYNSKLARIIQQQGKGQLGLGWGSPKNPNCGGLTPAQLTSLDFSLMNFSEFYADVLKRQMDTNAAATHVQSHAQSILNTMGAKYQNYFDN